LGGEARLAQSQDPDFFREGRGNQDPFFFREGRGNQAEEGNGK